MFFHKAELAGYSSVVGQPIMLLNECGACIGQLSLIGYHDDDYKKAVADIADALNEITRLREQLAAAEANCDAELTAALMAAQERHKADKLAAMERVREAAANIVERNGHSLHIEIRALKLDALAEGEK